MTVDPDVVARARKGEDEAWREIHRRLHGGVRRVCLGFANLGSGDVEDVVQETFVKTFRNISQLRDERTLVAWVMAIARSTCLNRLERQKAQDRLREGFAKDPAIGGVSSQGAIARQMEVQTDRDTRIQLVRQLISDLPEGPERTTVELFYVEGQLSARQIAEKLGIGKSTVTMRLERFRAKVKKRLLARMIRAEVAA